MPDGPGAAPLRAERTFLQNNSGSNSNGCAGTAVALPDKWSRGIGGLRAELVNCAKVAKFPRATSAPSRAWRPADSSPTCTSASALCTLLWMLSCLGLRDARTFDATPARAHSSLASNNDCH